MVSEVVIRECLDALLAASSDEQQLECFTYLIATVGEDFSHQQLVGALVQEHEFTQCTVPVGVHHSLSSAFGRWSTQSLTACTFFL